MFLFPLLDIIQRMTDDDLKGELSPAKNIQAFQIHKKIKKILNQEWKIPIFPNIVETSVQNFAHPTKSTSDTVRNLYHQNPSLS